MLVFKIRVMSLMHASFLPCCSFKVVGSSLKKLGISNN